MRARLLSVTMCLAVWATFGISSPARGSQRPSAAGVWSGSIAVPGSALNVSVALTNAAADVWTGTIDIPAQGARGMALDNITVAGPDVSFRIRGVPGEPTFNGRVAADGNGISGTFSQGGATIPFTLSRGAPPAPKRPQNPAPPFPYKSEDVRFRNASAGVQFAGTLTLPPASKPTAAVVLISGSGPQDRDESLFGHKPFLVLADHLTRAGIAVLRVDDRGVGGSDRGPDTATTEDYAGDALAAVAFLKTRPEIDGRRIGLVGHSEGGLVAPMAAVRSPDVAFIVLLSGPGLPGDQVLMAQVDALARAQGASPIVIAWDRAMRQQIYALVKSETGGVPDVEKRRALIESIGPVPGATDPAPARAQAAAILNAASGPWFRFMLGFDPRPTLQQVKCPVLALGGSLDLQVNAAQNLPAIESALTSRGNRNVTVKMLPNLNHLLQTATTGSPTEYETIEETMAPSALAIVTEWLQQQAGS